MAVATSRWDAPASGSKVTLNEVVVSDPGHVGHTVNGRLT